LVIKGTIYYDLLNKNLWLLSLYLANLITIDWSQISFQGGTQINCHLALVKNILFVFVFVYLSTLLEQQSPFVRKPRKLSTELEMKLYFIFYIFLPNHPILTLCENVKHQQQKYEK